LQRVGASIRRIVEVVGNEEVVANNGQPKQRLTRESGARL